MKFWTGIIIGLIIGANMTLIVYSCIICAKKKEENPVGKSWKES